MKMSTTACRLSLSAAPSAIALLLAAPLTALSMDLDKTLAFQIPAEDLSSALIQFSEQARLQVIVSDDLTGETTQGVIGQKTIKQALNQLLDPAGLRYRVAGETSITVVKMSTSETRTSRAGQGAAIIRVAQNDENGQRSEAPNPDGSMESEATKKSPSADGGEDSANGLGEIVVTANKREERILDVPVSVSALSGEMLADTQSVRLEDYQSRVPGLRVTDLNFENSGTSLSIRGIGVVGIYVDDIAYGSTTALGSGFVPDLDPLDLERVEVLRGPQGTLYGAGAMGGLFKYVTAAPDPTRTFGRVEVDGSLTNGGGDGYGLRAAGNIPLTSDLALRVSFFDRQDPGFIDDPTHNQQNVAVSHTDGGRLSLGWNPSSDWRIRLTGLVQDQKTDGSPSVDFDPTTQQPVTGPLDQLRIPNADSHKAFSSNESVEIEGDLHGLTFTSSTGVNNTDATMNLGLPVSAAVSQDEIDTKKFVQEVRLASAKSDGLTWMVGAFFTTEHTSLYYTSLGVNVDTGERDDGPLQFLITEDTKYRGEAVFANATYRFTPKFDLDFGGRYSLESQTFNEFVGGSFVDPPEITEGTENDHAFTYLISPKFHPTSNSMVYLRFASGFHPGGPNPYAGNDALPSYKPDKVATTELGYKADLLDREVTLDASIYYINWTDQQIPGIGVNDLAYIQNAGGSRSKGAEIAASWRPFHGLEFSGNVSNDDAQLTRDLPLGGGKSGDSLPNTPKWTGQLDANYEFPLDVNWHGFVGASFEHVGQQHEDFADGFVHPAYNTTDLRLGVRDDSLTFMLYGKNLGNSHGQLSGAPIDNLEWVSIIQPRTLGFSVTARF
jgi:iron complex outermembrane receptor protein